jgi:hypothetical protein
MTDLPYFPRFSALFSHAPNRLSFKIAILMPSHLAKQPRLQRQGMVFERT